MSSTMAALVSAAIDTAAKKLRSFLDGDYARYESTLHALDVVDAQLLALPLSGDLAVAAADWMFRLDEATNALEDVVQDMEEAAAAEPSSSWLWWRRETPHDAVARWLGSDHENMTRMEVAVGRLASIYVQGGELLGESSTGDIVDDKDQASESHGVRRAKQHLPLRV